MARRRVSSRGGVLSYVPIGIRKRRSFRALLPSRRRTPSSHCRQAAMLARLDTPLHLRPVSRPHRIRARSRANVGPGHGGRRAGGAAGRHEHRATHASAADECVCSAAANDDTRQRRIGGECEQRCAFGTGCRACGRRGERRGAARRAVFPRSVQSGSRYTSRRCSRGNLRRHMRQDVDFMQTALQRRKLPLDVRRAIPRVHAGLLLTRASIFSGAES
jgi:hypothetical protein